jgi:hypothetical protein
MRSIGGGAGATSSVRDPDTLIRLATVGRTTAADTGADLANLALAISAAMVELYATVYDHGRTTARAHINDDIVVWVLESILTGRVVAFLNANQTTPGVACELVFLEPVAGSGTSS